MKNYGSLLILHFVLRVYVYVCFPFFFSSSSTLLFSTLSFLFFFFSFNHFLYYSFPFFFFFFFVLFVCILNRRRPNEYHPSFSVIKEEPSRGMIQAKLFATSLRCCTRTYTFDPCIFFFFFLKFFFLSTLCFSCYISIIVRFPPPSPPPSLPSQKITSHTCTRISAQSNTCCTSIIAICSHRCINRICDRREKNYNSTFNC